MNDRSIVAAFCLAVFTATTVTMLWAFPITFIPPLFFFGLGFSLTGLPIAALTLGAAFYVAHGAQPSRVKFVTAGVLAGLGSALLCAWMGDGLHRGFLTASGRLLFGTHPGLHVVMRVGLGMVFAGGCAGWVFGWKGFPGKSAATPQVWAALAAALIVCAPVLYGYWLRTHDPIGDALCPHDTTVRTVVAGTLYVIPVGWQPEISGAPPGKIFERHRWDGTAAAKAARDELTYCQTAADTPWKASFYLFGAHVPALPRLGNISVGLEDADRVARMQRDWTRFTVPQDDVQHDPDLWFLPEDGVVPEKRIRNERFDMAVPLKDGSTLRIHAYTGQGTDEMTALRSAGRVLRSLQSPQQP